MKKQLLVLISLLLFFAISFSSVAQSNSGGKFDASTAKTLKQMNKALKKGDLKSFSTLKSGILNKINCLDSIYCGGSGAVELLPNTSGSDDWSGFVVISWKVFDYTLGAPGVEFDASLNIITQDVVTKKWYFHPDRVPSYMTGNYLKFNALPGYGSIINPFIITKTDWALFYQKPVVFNITSVNGSICDGDPYNITLDGSTNVFNGVNTIYYLLKNGVATGDSVIGNGNPISFSVLAEDIYTISAKTEYGVLFPATNYPACEVLMNGSTDVKVNPLPDINVAQYNAPLCENATLNLTGSTNTVPSTFGWADANGWSAVGGTASRANISLAQGGFYTLTATSLKGCVNDSSILVVVNPLPVITLTGNVVPCVNSAGNVYTTEPGMANYAWTIPAGGTKTAGGSATDNTVTITWTTSGTKTLSVNYTDANTCGAASPKTLSIDVKPLPVITLTGSIKGCVNVAQTYTTDAGMTNYVWTYDASATLVSGGTASDNTITLVWATAGAKSVTATYTDLNNCNPVSPKTLAVTINAVPSPTITGPTPICAGSLNQAYFTESGAGISGWVWTVTGGSFVGGINNTSTVHVDWNNSTSATTGTLTVNYLNVNGCTAPIPTSKTITLNAQPDITLNGVSLVCAGSTGNVYTTDAGMAGYTWTISAGGAITAGAGTNAATVTWNTAGAQWVRVTYTAPNGCTASSPKQYDVTVQAAPVPSITGAASGCINSVGNIYTTEAGMSNYTWSVSGGTINSGLGTNQISVTWTGLGAQTVQINYDNASGCHAVAPVSKSVTVNPLPLPTITGVATACANTSTSFSTEAGMSGYVWTVTGGSIQSGQGTKDVTILWGAVNPLASVSVTYVNLNNCSPSAPTSKSINVLSVNTPTITGSQSVCLNQAGLVYSTEAGMSSYLWTITGGVITAGAGTNNVTVKWTSVGNQSISVNYTNSNGCPGGSPTSLSITVHALPVPTITGSANSCIGSTGVIYSTEAGMSGYAWTISAGGSITSGAGTNSITVTWNALGAQNVKVNYSDVSGCAAATATQYDVTVNALPVPTISGGATACQGVVSTYSTETSMVGYLWTVSSAGTIQSGQGTNTINVLWSNVGAAESISVTYSNGCSAATPTIKSINVGATPLITITGLNSGICMGATNVDYSTAAGKSNYQWSIVGGSITSGLGTDKVKVTWSSSGNQSISVNYQDVNGCSAPAPTTLNVSVSAIPTPTITGSANECVGASNVLYTTESGSGENSYQWSVSAGGQILSGLGTNQISVKWNSAGAQNITVNYKNAGGCTAPSATSYSVTVNAIPVPTITGSLQACVGSSKTYITEAGKSNYIWAVSSGGIISSGQGTNTIQVSWNTAGSSESVSVIYSDAIGCTPASPTSIGVNVTSLPVISFGGSTGVCTNSTVTYKAPPGSSGWLWTIVGGAVVNVGAPADSVQVKWPASAGTGTISLNYKDANGCFASAPLDKTITVGAQSTPSITGSNAICAGATNLTYSTESGMSGYTWVVSSGGIIKSGAGTDIITVDWTAGSGAQTVSVNYTDPSGCPVVGPTVFNVQVTPLPITEVITGSSSACLNSTSTYSIPAGYTNIIWSVSANGAIIGVNNTNSVQVQWNGLGAGNVNVAYTNVGGCSPTILPILNVNVTALPLPTISSTGSTVCQGSVGEIYTTEAGMSNYSWNVTGGTITSGAATNSITVDWVTSGAGTVTVNYQNASGCTAALPTIFNVTVNPKPVPIIAGSINTCLNSVGQNYSTSGAGTVSNYVWAISGGSITSGLGTNQVTVTWTSTTNTWLKVTYDEGGCTGVSAQYNVTVNDLPIAQSAVTSPINGEYCSGSMGVDVILVSSEPTVKYELYDATSTLIGTVAAGTVPVKWSNVTLGTYSVKGVNASGCSSIVASGIVVKMNSLPAIFSINPTGIVSGCNGGAGYNISLAGVVSESGVSYQLLLNGAPTGVPILSSGASINFGPQFAFGTYSILGTNSSTGCSQIMTGSFTMNPDAATTIYNVTSFPASGQFCNAPLNGVDIGLSGSDVGVNYILRTGILDVDTVVGTGNPITFARVTAAGSYFVEVSTLSGCRATMTGSIDVQPVAPPSAFSLVADNSGYYCSGDGGVGLYISGQQKDIVYELYVAGNPVPIDTQTGLSDNPALPLHFINLYTTGTYSVFAKNPVVSGCLVAMLNNVTVNMNPLPTLFIVSSGGNYCAGSSTTLNLSGSQATAEYRWVNSLDNSTSAWTIGSGSALSFPIVASGDYTIEARIISNGITCAIPMTGTANIIGQALPSDVSVTSSGGTSCNDGVVITVKSSQFGVIYSAIDLGSNTTPIATITGTGLDISFAPIVDSGKNYQVQADLNGCTKMVGTPIVINVSGVIVKQLVTGGGSFCTGGSAIIGLADTELGVQYDLMLADVIGGPSSTPAIASMVGDGFGKNFSAAINASGEYFVSASSGSCVNDMSNRVTVSLNPPVVSGISVAPANVICETSGATFTGTGGDRYTFYLNNVSQGVAVADTYILPTVTNGDQVKVLVENTVTGCSSTTFPITMSVVKQLKIFNLLSVSGGIICPASSDSLYLDNTELGVDYILYNALNVALDTISGNNGVVYYTGIGTGTYHVVAEKVGGSPCGTQIMNNTVTVNVAALPTIFNLSPTGVENGCLGGNIDIDGSDATLTYNLVRDSAIVMDSKIGTGAVLSFTKPLVEGNYTVEVVYGNGCKLYMNGNLQIINPPTENTYVLSGNPADGRYCNDGTNLGVQLTLSNSDATKAYSLILNNLTHLKDTISVGGAINFGYFSSTGFYSAQVASSNGCNQLMDSVIHIVPVTPPTAFALQVDGSGFYCLNGGVGVGIQLLGQQDNVIYELYMGGVIVGTAIGIVDNPASVLPFKNIVDNSFFFTAKGNYSVTARYSTPTGCSVNMLNSVNVSPSADPTSYTVSSAGDYCEGGSTVINVNGSDANVDYRWVNISTTDAGSWISGTGGLLQFVNINIPGDYVVEAKNNIGSPCPAVMVDTLSIKETKMPLQRNATVKNGADCSTASLVIVENAEIGVTYTLVDVATDTPTSIFFVGTTNLLDTMQVIDTNGLYYIQAQRGACPVRITPDLPVINNVGAVKKHIVTPVDASICNGDLGVKFGLSTNTLGIKYILYWSVDKVKDFATDQKVDSIIGNGGVNQQFKKMGKKPGLYYVVGSNTVSSCTNYMLNDPELIVNPLPTAYQMTGSGMYCDPDPDPTIGGAEIGLSKQEDRILYTLQQYDALDNYVNDIIEFRGSLSGLPFSFGQYKEDGLNNTYRVVAIDTITGCTSNMNGEVVVMHTPFAPIKPVVNLGLSNGRYCKGTNGVEIKIDSPQAGLTYSLVEQRVPIDTVLVERIAATTNPLVVGYYGLGTYYVNASWGGDACTQASDPFTITERIPIAFHVDYDCGVTPTATTIVPGGYISLDSSEVGITYMVYDQLSNLVGFKNGIDTAMVFDGLYGAGTYTVQGTCSPIAPPVAMADTVTIAFPDNSYNVVFKNSGTTTSVRGDTIQQTGSELLTTYYLRVNSWVDTFLVGTGVPVPPLEFPTDSSGIYNLLAISDKHCASYLGNGYNAMETMLRAYNDTIFFAENALTGSVFVGNNDIIDRLGADQNVVFSIVTKGVNPDVKLDPATGEFTYVKSPTFFGKDSIRYEVRNVDNASRVDTALIWVYVGNKPINGKTFLIPNAFSPNGDGLNDYYVISTVYAYSTEESQLEVFNRWGSLVYRSKGKAYDNSWDGKMNAGMISIGADLPNGTYFYIFKVTFNIKGVLNKEEYNGYIELRR